jgi:hypothetical protein
MAWIALFKLGLRGVRKMVLWVASRVCASEVFRRTLRPLFWSVPLNFHLHCPETDPFFV